MVYCAAFPSTVPNVSAGSQNTSSALANVNVVLVSPKSPENIGSCLRAAANFGAGSLTLVSPRCDPTDDAIARLACNSPLMGDITVLPTLADALADMHVSVAFTRRTGGARLVHPSIQALIAAHPMTLVHVNGLEKPIVHGEGGCSEVAMRRRPSAALVFGREENGLLDGEVSQCSHAAAIPTNPAFPSINLSHAVAVTLASLSSICIQGMQSFADDRAQFKYKRGIEPASQGDIDALLHRIKGLLKSAGIDEEMLQDATGGGGGANHGRRKKPVGHLNAVLRRSNASVAEVRGLHLLLTKLEALEVS